VANKKIKMYRVDGILFPLICRYGLGKWHWEETAVEWLVFLTSKVPLLMSCILVMSVHCWNRSMVTC
jgi:hypothetical protein